VRPLRRRVPEYCLALVPFEDLELPEEERRALAERAEAGDLPLSAMIKDATAASAAACAPSAVPPTP